MIRYRDFAPARIAGGFLKSDRYESFDSAVAAANVWIAEQKVEVVSLETVVLPNIFEGREEGTSDGSVETEEAMTSVNVWHQFLRVWYHG